MNKRIEELAKEHGLIHIHMSTGEYNDTLKRFETFAELIVRECVDIAYEYDAPKLSGPGMIIGNRLEEHFGVEE